MLKRIENLRGLLSENTAVIISSYPNIFYYSGFTSGDAWLIISKDRLILVTDSRYTIQAKEQSADFEVIDISVGWEKIFEGISEEFIGYEECNLTVWQHQFFVSKAPSKKFVSAQKQINYSRRNKSNDEIKIIAEAEKIGDDAFMYILDRIKAGRTEREIALELEFYMKKQGANALSFDTIAASGIRSAMPHGIATDKVLEKGDFLTLDFGCVYKGYCSDMTRTVVLGKADEKQKEVYNIVLNAQEEAIKSLQKGRKCSDVDNTARKIISDAGYGKNFGHGLGHSVGIEIHETPTLSPKCGDIIEEGHVITVEPGIYIENFGGVRIEDLIAVTSDGVKNLSSSPKILIEI